MASRWFWHHRSFHQHSEIYSLKREFIYIPLQNELGHPMKGLINIKNNDDECFRWCHIHHLNPIEKKKNKKKNYNQKKKKKKKIK